MAQGKKIITINTAQVVYHSWEIIVMKTLLSVPYCDEIETGETYIRCRDDFLCVHYCGLE